MLATCCRAHCRPRPLLALVCCQPRFASAKSYDPLRVLFCGSDKFSIASLQALDHEKRQGAGRVASIDVVCRPEKPVRRHLRAVREVPIAATARSLGLPLHQIDTFTTWTPPTPPHGPFNLIIAVSFGLLIPARILTSAKYGGLNVHPSMLPEFPGPAPLHHTLLADRKTTGVTLQTLHPTKFDEGKIVAQTPYPGIEIQARTVEELQALTAPLGANMLLQSLKDGSFVPPIKEAGWYKSALTSRDFTHASKIGPKDRHLDWTTWSADDILRRQRVIGPLWNTTETCSIGNDGERKEAKRIIWDHGFHLLKEECHLFPATGHPIIVGLRRAMPKVYIRTCDGNVLVADSVKVEGEAATAPFQAAKRNGLAPIPKRVDGNTQFPHDFVAFHSPLT
ncbi:Methionyl-tRNA formyltransferase [Xanthoria parietina]